MTITYEQWITVPTPDSCQPCLDLHHTIWQKGQGPQPPKHEHCHCRRVFHHRFNTETGEESR